MIPTWCLSVIMESILPVAGCCQTGCFERGTCWHDLCQVRVDSPTAGGVPPAPLVNRGSKRLKVHCTHLRSYSSEDGTWSVHSCAARSRLYVLSLAELFSLCRSSDHRKCPFLLQVGGESAPCVTMEPGYCSFLTLLPGRTREDSSGAQDCNS